MFEGSSIVVEINRRSRRQRRHAAAVGMKPFHARPLHLRHSIQDELATQKAWDIGLGLAPSPGEEAHGRRRVASSSTGVSKWESRGKYQDGRRPTWFSERKALQSFTPVQLDVFHAKWDLCVVQNPKKPPRKKGTPYTKSRAFLELFPIGCRVCVQSNGQSVKGTVTGYARRKSKMHLESGYHVLL